MMMAQMLRGAQIIAPIFAGGAAIDDDHLDATTYPYDKQSPIYFDHDTMIACQLAGKGIGITPDVFIAPLVAMQMLTSDMTQDVYLDGLIKIYNHYQYFSSRFPGPGGPLRAIINISMGFYPEVQETLVAQKLWQATVEASERIVKIILQIKSIIIVTTTGNGKPVRFHLQHNLMISFNL